jgi:hypothetical protein
MSPGTVHEQLRAHIEKELAQKIESPTERLQVHRQLLSGCLVMSDQAWQHKQL